MRGHVRVAAVAAVVGFAVAVGQQRVATTPRRSSRRQLWQLEAPFPGLSRLRGRDSNPNFLIQSQASYH